MTSVPASARSAPVRILMKVDLPAPFSPTSACTSPADRSNETRFKARTPANALLMERASRSGVIKKKSDADGSWMLPQRFAAIRNSGAHIVLRTPERAHFRRTPTNWGRGLRESKNLPRDPYLVKSVVHSSQLLSAFRSSGEALPLREIATRSGLPKSMAFRLLYTLERCGMIEKVGENLYRSHLRPFKQKPFRLGYAAQGTDYQFSKEVSSGLQRAAAAQGLELICVDNRYNAKIAQRNADVLVREKVDLVIEFQTDEHVAPIVAAKYREAGIPMIALEIPHPGATYFGANNYEAGLIGGRHLGRWGRQQRYCDAHEIVLLALERAGSLPRMRLTGMLVGMKETCPALEHCQVTYLDGDGKLGE